jgi:hypothetical protein
MNGAENTIKGGVIIMGSLFWVDEKNCVKGKENEGKARRVWRENNLDLAQTKSIQLPVRYGRFSGDANRKNTYTMVLSRDYLAHLGTALVVPFSRSFLINEKTKIREQIIKLAKVEGIHKPIAKQVKVKGTQKNDDVVFAKCWGAISIWINPNGQYFPQLRNYWINNIINRQDTDGKNIHGYQDKNYSWNDGTLLDNNFQLQLPIVSDLDFLLCTYISPKHIFPPNMKMLQIIRNVEIELKKTNAKGLSYG